MADLYKTIQGLCSKNGIKAGKMCADLGISRGIISDLKYGRRKGLSTSNAQKIASYFYITVDQLLGDDTPTNTPIEDEKISTEAHHIGVLFDRADEKDKLLTHSVLDKYEDGAEDNVVYINPSQRNPGRMVEFDVYDQTAAAGLGNYLDTPQSHREQWPSLAVPRGTDFAIVISGDSMEPKIHDGDMVFVKKATKIDPGKVGIFLWRGEAYCKQLVLDRQNKEVHLHSLNPKYSDIIITAETEEDLRTIGLVL